MTEEWKVLVRDNDCHWYVIPYSELFNFPHWVSACEECAFWDGFDFETCQLQGGPEGIMFRDMKLLNIG